MPMRFTDLARDTMAATLDVSGAVIHFRFRPGLITPRFMHDFLQLDESRMKGATAAEQQETLFAVSEQVARIVAEWDLTEVDDVTMFPLTVERLAADIPLFVQIQMLQTCLAEMQPGEASAPGANGSASKPASGAGSSRKAASGRRRTGTR